MSAESAGNGLSKIRLQKKQDEASFNLILGWLAIVCLTAIFGFVFGLIVGTGEEAKELTLEYRLAMFSLAALPVFMVAIATYCVRKTYQYLRLK